MTENQRIVREKTGWLMAPAFADEIAGLADWQFRIIRDMLDSRRPVQIPAVSRRAHGVKRAAVRRWVDEITGIVCP